MRKTNRNVFLCELKRYSLLPAIVAAAYLIAEIIMSAVCFFSAPDIGRIIAFDRIAEIFLYVFFAVTLVWSSFRLFADKRFYDKLRINPDKLFLLRIFFVFGACAAFTLVLIGFGTLHMAALGAKDDFLYAEAKIKPILFSYQGKCSYYFLFAIAVGLSAATAYSVVVGISNIIYSRSGVLVRVGGGALMVAAIVVAFCCVTRSLPYMPDKSGSFEYSLPVGKLIFDELTTVVSYKQLVASAYPSVILCYVAWNVLSPMDVIVALLFITWVYFSSAFFNCNRNDSYLYDKEQTK